MLSFHILSNVLPNRIRSFLCLMAIILSSSTLRAVDYYVDPAGNDSNHGTSPSAPWQSLGKVNGTVFQPGDQILFKRGGTWFGTLSPQGQGDSSATIRLSSYGEGAKPLIHGNGNWAVISLSSQSYWTIDGFEVTNWAGNDSSRSGIRIDASGSGTLRGIKILNNVVRDVRGIKNVNDGGRNNGGIFFWINEPGKADGVLIEGNTVKNVYGQGIAFNAEAEYMGGGMNYANCSPNVIARGNTVLTTSGDGILMLGTDNELVEYNEVGYVGHLSDWYNNIAAAWPTRHVGGLWQYNHVHHTAALNANDSTAFDNDGFVRGATIFQYNYTHDNAGGFLMEYTWGGDEFAQTIARYNISWNESRILATNRNSARIYNNVFYNPGATLDVTWTSNPSFVLFTNNIFVGAARSPEFTRQLFMTNTFSGGVTRPVTIDGNRTENPLFVDPNTNGNLAGFLLQTSSLARNSGSVIASNGGKDFWGVTLPTSAPHRGAAQINRISDFTATASFLRLTGSDAVEIPQSGSNASLFVPMVRDQNFRPMASAAITWSIRPAVSGVSMDADGTLRVASNAVPRRIAVQATSGGAVAEYSVALYANHGIAYEWAGGNGNWNDTSSSGWNGGPPVNGDRAWIGLGSVASTANNQQSGIAITVAGSGLLRSGGHYLTPGNLTFTDGGTVQLENTGHYANYGGGLLPQTVAVRGSSTTGAFLLGGADHAFWNMSQGTVFDVDDITGDMSADLTISAGLKDAVGSPDTAWNPSGIEKTGKGTMKLTSVNTYTGGTTIREGTVEIHGGSGGSGLVRGWVTVNAGGTLAITGGDGTGFGWNTPISHLTIHGGSVQAQGGSHIGFGSFTHVGLHQGGTISGSWQWNGDSLLSFTSSGDSTNEISGSLTLRSDAGANHTFDVADGAAAIDLRVNATLSDIDVSWLAPSHLIKAGNGTMALTARNSYDGNTIIHAGKLILGDGTSHSNLADGAAVVVASGAKLHLDYSGTDTVSSLIFAGISRPPGVYTSTNSPFITGSGSLTVTNGPSNVFAAWASLHQVAGSANADDDHDGASNFAEFAFGQDPQKGPSFQPLTAIPDRATGTFHYTRRNATLSGLTFRVWTSTNLADWTEDLGAVQTVIEQNSELQEVQVSLSQTLLNHQKLFVQIRAQDR
jgi:autotransporter-associated beta strand protein